jgi:helix-turn-helix protein
MAHQAAPLAYTVRDVSLLIGRSEAAIRAMIARRQLPARRQGGRVFIMADELRAFLDRLAQHRSEGQAQ